MLINHAEKTNRSNVCVCVYVYHFTNILNEL
jgi:hypothetical protein